MANTTLIKDFDPKTSHHIFLDANVLLYVFAPIGNYKLSVQQEITKFLDLCQSVGANLYVTSMVISEVCNVIIRDDFKSWTLKPANSGKTDFKRDYRPSQSYKDIVAAIKSVVKSITKLASRFPDNFHNIDLELLSDLTIDADFNDAYFLQLAAQQKWVICTRDRDIINHPKRQIDVITNLT